MCAIIVCSVSVLLGVTVTEDEHAKTSEENRKGSESLPVLCPLQPLTRSADVHPQCPRPALALPPPSARRPGVRCQPPIPGTRAPRPRPNQEAFAAPIADPPMPSRPCRRHPQIGARVGACTRPRPPNGAARGSHIGRSSTNLSSSRVVRSVQCSSSLVRTLSTQRACISALVCPAISPRPSSSHRTAPALI